MNTECARPVSDIIVYAHGERVGLLEYHADIFAKLIHIGFSVNINLPDFEVAFYAAASNEIIHAVKAFQKS